MRTTDISIDVRAVAGLADDASLAASLHLPDRLDNGAALELLVCVHGGGYQRSYWNAQFDTFAEYSFAAHATAHGRAVLAIDLLGMGDSTTPEPESLLSRVSIAAANDHATRTVLAALQDGTHARAGAVIATGIGHSIGGMMVITQQAAQKSFARLAVLGWTNQAMVLGDADPAAMAAALRPGYLATDRATMRALFYAPDVPAALIAADEANASLTPSCLGRDALTPGIVHAASAEIAVPVFLMHGAIDTSPDPYQEPSFFGASPDVTLMVLEHTGHCHNFATLRHRLWHRLDRWIASLPVPA